MSETTEQLGCTIPAAWLEVVSAVTQAHSRYALGHVQVRIAAGGLIDVAATDGQALVVASGVDEAAHGAGELYIPPGVCHAILAARPPGKRGRQRPVTLSRVDDRATAAMAGPGAELSFAWDVGGLSFPKWDDLFVQSPGPRMNVRACPGRMATMMTALAALLPNASKDGVLMSSVPGFRAMQFCADDGGLSVRAALMPMTAKNDDPPALQGVESVEATT